MIRTVFTSKRALGIHARQRNRLGLSVSPEIAARRRKIARRMEWRGAFNAAVAELHEVAYELTVVLPIAAMATLIWLVCLLP